MVFPSPGASAVTLMAAGPALAGVSTDWNVRKGGGKLYVGAVMARVRGGAPALIKDTTTNKSFMCAKASVSASVTKSHSVTSKPFQFGHLKKAGTTWSACAGAIPLKAHLSTSTDMIAMSHALSVTTGAIMSGNKISIMISSVGNKCKASLSGPVIPMKYVNATHSLKINSGNAVTLAVKSAAGCGGNLNKGDKAYVKGVYAVFAPASLTIS